MLWIIFKPFIFLIIALKDKTPYLLHFVYDIFIQITAYDLATQCPSRRASAKRHSAKCVVPLMSLTGTTSLPQSRPQSRQHAGLTDSSLSQGPSPNISLNPSPSLSPQPRARQPRRAYTIAEGKNEKVPGEEWEDDADRVRNIIL